MFSLILYILLIIYVDFTYGVCMCVGFLFILHYVCFFNYCVFKSYNYLFYYGKHLEMLCNSKSAIDKLSWIWIRKGGQMKVWSVRGRMSSSMFLLSQAPSLTRHSSHRCRGGEKGHILVSGSHFQNLECALNSEVKQPPSIEPSFHHSSDIILLITCTQFKRSTGLNSEYNEVIILNSNKLEDNR